LRLIRGPFITLEISLALLAFEVGFICF